MPYTMYFYSPVQILIWFLVCVIILSIIVRIIARTGNRIELFNRPTALDVLKERYAKGEINREEYEQKKKDIQ